MATLTIKGSKKLSGKINVAGNKNSVLPIMAACLLTSETCMLKNVPNISDVKVMAKLLILAGAKVTGIGTNKLSITAENLEKTVFPNELT